MDESNIVEVWSYNHVQLHHFITCDRAGYCAGVMRSSAYVHMRVGRDIAADFEEKVRYFMELESKEGLEVEHWSQDNGDCTAHSR